MALYAKETVSKAERERPMCAVIMLVMQRSDGCTYSTNMLEVYYRISKGKRSIVETHKALFGPQSYCWNGEFRYWVWDFGTWTIHVSNKRGIAIEVNFDMTPEDAWKVLEKYWKKFGIR